MKTKTGILFVIYAAVAAIITSVVRFFQYETIMEPLTGFFKQGCEAKGVIIYIVLAVFGIGFIALTIIGKKKGWTAVTVSSDGMGEKATLISGISYLVAALVMAFSVVNTGIGGFKGIAAAGLLLCFGVIGFCLVKNSIPPALAGFLNLYPALYFFMLSTEHFVTDLTIKNRSDSLILLFIYVLATLFFASAARFYARVETKFSRTREIILGGLAFILSFVHIFSKAMVHLIGGPSLKVIDEIGLNEVVVFVITAAFLVMICTAKQSKEIEYIIEEKEEKKED